MGLARWDAQLQPAWLLWWRMTAALSRCITCAESHVQAAADDKTTHCVHAAAQGLPGQCSLASIEGVMQQEYALAVRMCGRGDFAEGVRAQVVDKDKRPSWQPARLQDVSEGLLDSIFAPMPKGLGLDLVEGMKEPYRRRAA